MINLLPSQYKKELELEETLRLLLILGISVFVFLVSLMLMLFSLRVYFQGQIVSQDILIESFRKESLQQGFALQELQDTNKTLLNVQRFYENQTLPSEALEKISLRIPQNVYLTAVLFSSPQPAKKGESKQSLAMSISLRGFAPTRESLLSFRDGLAKDSAFQDIQFPLSNFANPSDITFSASLKYAP